MEVQHPHNLIQQYLNISVKLKKFDRVIFKRFLPNVAEVSSDFHKLALRFEECALYQYAAMCFLGAAKCEKSLTNTIGEIDFYLKSARAFLKAEKEEEKLNLKSNRHEYIEGALKSYTNALANLSEDSAMKAALIREMKSINPNFEGFSSFSSPCHRIYDLEISATESINSADYLQALEKLTDIFDNITERKKEHLYVDVLSRNEVLRLLLLLILDLPPARQSPSHIKILEKYSSLDMLSDCEIPENIQNILKSLVISWLECDSECIVSSLAELSQCEWINGEHRKLVDYLIIKYSV